MEVDDRRVRAKSDRRAAGAASGNGGLCPVPRRGGGCTPATAIRGETRLAVSRDGRELYAAASLSDAVAVFARAAGTGALTQPAPPGGCVGNTAVEPRCTRGRHLQGAAGVAVAPDGRNVYVAARESRAVTVFSRR